MANHQRQIVLIIHNVRSLYNVGSLLRTADGLGIKKVFMTGYTPYPEHNRDKRLPHVRLRASNQIAKTALGAEKNVDWEPAGDIQNLLNSLRREGYKIAGLEQTERSINLVQYRPPKKIALVVGSETTGLERAVLAVCEDILEIPMFGPKESFNVGAASAIALYHLKFLPQSLDK